jgi:hypothetical protein
MKRCSFHGDCARILEGESIVLEMSDLFRCTEQVMATNRLIEKGIVGNHSSGSK